MEKGDVATARRLLADDLKFEGPLDTFEKAEPYLNARKQLALVLERVDVTKVLAESDAVARSCDLPVRPRPPKTFVGERLVVRGGTIASIRIAFDAQPFAAIRHHRVHRWARA